MRIRNTADLTNYSKYYSNTLVDFMRDLNQGAPGWEASTVLTELSRMFLVIHCLGLVCLQVMRVAYVWVMCRDQTELNPRAAWRLLDLSANSQEQYM